MKSRSIQMIVIIVLSLAVFGNVALAEQDKYMLRAPNGVTFSEFRGYETWPVVAVSEIENGLKVILGNTVMINSYRAANVFPKALSLQRSYGRRKRTLWLLFR